MRTDLHLFIGDREVDFSTDPKILFNFKISELTNPTIVKNSWSKQISIPSTPTNDDIFNHFYNFQRTNYGVDFNAMMKAPFSLYINGTLVQNGYAKLDAVKITHNTAEYQLHLYGGIGDFLYNLSYNDGSLSDEKKTLASLQYVADEFSVKTEPNLDFIINKDTVNEAWNYITQPSSKWSIINFAPCYNGIPADFDANKVLINNKDNAVVFQKGITEGGVTYRPVYGGSQDENGYSLGEASEEMTCDETFDFRSYLQRPVVNVRRVIDACCDPSNNGGYQVKLGSWFHQNNPYWTKSWCTLQMLRDLEVEAGQTEQITGATVSNTSKNRKNITFSTSSLSQLNNVRLKLNVGLVSSAITGSVSTVYTSYNYHSNSNTINTSYVRDYFYNGGAIFMLVGRDSNGVICAKSKAYCLSSSKETAYSWPIWENFSVDGYPAPDKVEFIQGMWKKIGGVWRFCNMKGERTDIEFTFPTSAPIATLEIMTQTHSTEKTVYKVWGESSSYYSPDISFVDVWPNQSLTENALKTYAQVKSPHFMTNFTYNIVEFYAEATDYEALFSNTYIPKERLLSTSYTPAEFLVSFCRMFGLLIYRNPNEEADNTDLCPRGVIHIMDRDEWFTEEYVDITERIDRGKTMTLTPTLAGSKWYDLSQEPISSDAGDAYKQTYGYDYGRQLINTNYNFDNNTTKLLDGNIFKSGVMVREKDKYFAMPYNGAPIYAWNGFKYNLFAAGDNGWDSVEMEIPVINLSNTVDINSLGHKGYDSMPKLQCHTDDNEAADGAGVLLFYKDEVSTINDYWLTDDVLEMQTLNGGNACWLCVGGGIDAGGNTIGIRRNRIPQFTRDLINFGLQEGNIVNSWNFGHPQVVFSPNTYTTDGDSIYDKCFKDYYTDLYDQDSKKLDCYVNFLGIPNNEWLRKFYWFDNTVWVLWEIKDFNYTDPTSVLCTFVKVKDVANYRLAPITDAGNQSIVLNTNRIPNTGATVTGTIYLQSGGHWFSVDSDGVIYGYDLQGNYYTVSNALRPHTGQGQTSAIQVVFPASTASTEITWNICFEDDYDNTICTQVIQEGDNSPYLDFAPQSKNVTVGINAQTYVLYFVAENIRPNSVTVTSNSPVWVDVVSVDEVTSAITLSVSASTMGGLRTAQLTINGIGVNGAVVNNQTLFKQEGSDIDIDFPSVTFNYNETGTNRIQIITSSQWTATINDSNGQ